MVDRKGDNGGENPRGVEGGSKPPAIELRHLRYFLAVSEELHFGRAAERLHIAQPPLSQAIRKLEDELGVKLLNRTSRVVTPTAAGLAFAEEARYVLASFEHAVSEARRAGGAGNVLRIGSLPYLPIRRLMQFLEAARRRLPEWQTEITHLITPEQLRALRTGELDLAILHYAGEQEGLELIPLFTGEPLVAYLAPDDPLAAEPVIRPEHVADHTLVLFNREINPALHDWLLAVLADSGYHFKRIHAAGGSDILRDLLVTVATGAGINIAPFSVKEVSQAGDIVVRRPIDPPLAAPDTVVAVPADPPRRLEGVVAGVREIAHELRVATPQGGSEPLD